MAPVAVAKDRSWFGDDYTAFRFVFGNGVLVEGIGSVKLPVKRSPSSSRLNSHTTLLLTAVVHVPRATCNILGLPIAHEDKLGTNFKDPSKSSIWGQQGRPQAYFRKALSCQLLALRLSGPPVGPKFNDNDNDDDDEDDTSIMGKFRCGNKKCLSRGWGSKKVAIWIRRYPSGG
ncbi:hypothetical protein B0T25DRAFT_563800 [Lasiosphaeria hispida]|uniref:Uncharacterized protein n=1 Tax=Lasiosphaeria hispida TaxID=260671 RepID=A0AAJ0HNV6_9PEZI|nr:hypothetical protein B0T25DRAFT_563800 [Lasiosphaeria hispida]